MDAILGRDAVRGTVVLACWLAGWLAGLLAACWVACRPGQKGAAEEEYVLAASNSPRARGSEGAERVQRADSRARPHPATTARRRHG